MSAQSAQSQYDDTLCVLCGDGNNEHCLLLCDGCDKGFHTYCMNIPAIPIADWFCPACRPKTINGSGASSAVAMAAVAPARGNIYPGLEVHFYERVSSKGQDAPQYGRVGMDTQNSTMLQFALDNGLIIKGTIREVKSARNPSKLQRLREMCNTIQDGDCIIVYSASRFSRNLEQGRQMLETIHTAGGYVYSVTDGISSFDERFLHLLKEAHAESDRLSQKARDAYARIKLLGGHIGPAPFGWSAYHDSNGIRRLEQNSAEQQVLMKLREVYENTQQNAFATADILNALFMYNRNKAWTPNTIKKYLGSLTNNTFSNDLLDALSDM